MWSQDRGVPSSPKEDGTPERLTRDAKPVGMRKIQSSPHISLFLSWGVSEG